MKQSEAKFMYAVNNKFFNKLSEAMKYAYEQQATDIYLTKLGIADRIYTYHPMSERFERICKVNDAKKRMNEFLNTL